MPAKPKPKPAPLPKQTTHHALTLEQWLSNEANTEWLKHLISDPRFNALCHYATDINRVTSDDLFGQRALLPEAIVRKAAHHTGVVEFVNTIKNLPSLKKVRNTDQPEPWEHINPETK